MQRLERFVIPIAFLLLAFSWGWLASGGAGSVHAQAGPAAQSNAPQVDVRSLGPSNSLIVYYPDQQMVYVYTQPFVGLPDSYLLVQVPLDDAGRKDHAPAMQQLAETFIR